MPASQRSPRPWPRRTASRWCRWTGSTARTPSWSRWAGSSTRARRTPSTPRGTPRCCACCSAAGPCSRRLSSTGSRTRCRTPSRSRARPAWWSPRATTCCSTSRDGTPCGASATRSGTSSPMRRAAWSGWSRVTSTAGRSADDAREWVRRVDQANADLVEAAAGAADEVLDLSAWSGSSVSRRSGRPTARRSWLRIKCGSALFAYPQFMRHTRPMAPDPTQLDAVREALEAAADKDAGEALPHLREAADRLTALIDESMAEALLAGKVSLRSAGAAAGPHRERRTASAGPHPDPRRLRQRGRPGDRRRRRARQVRPRVRDAQAGAGPSRSTDAVQTTEEDMTAQ